MLYRFLPPTADKEAVTKALTGFISCVYEAVILNLCIVGLDYLVLFFGVVLQVSDITYLSVGVLQSAVAKGVRNISFGDLLGNLGTTM